MQRILTLSKFRNLGLEEPTTLILNHSIKKGEIGSLVILIGPNNSGKSNVIDALNAISLKNVGRRDVTTLSFANEDLVPEVKLGIRNQKNWAYYRIAYEQQATCELNINNQFKHPTKEILLKDLEAAKKVFSQRGIASVLDAATAKVRESEDAITVDFADEISSQIEKKCVYYNLPINTLDGAMPADGYWVYFRSRNASNPLKQVEAYCQSNYGVKFMPSIAFYKERLLKNSDLNSSPNLVNNSDFFCSLFKAIGIDPSEITNAYEQYQSFGNIATLKKIMRKIDRKIKIVNDRFNALYFAESDEYKFMVSLDTNSISFGMARGKDEDPIMLEYQSTGFRWFFDFFFNFIESGDLKPGDIVVMDEPATNLHPRGQKELRAFIKEFARKNDITFIIATHSPFLIDPDNYDEIRVVSSENNRAHIDNLFTAVNSDDPDSLRPIKESLTIEQNVLYDLDTEVVWVEGITDYNYLTMFKKLLGIKNIAFLPCNGIGKDQKTQEKILKRIVSIKFHKRNILLDADKAGQAMKKLCEGTDFNNAVSVSDLNDDDKKFVEIEDLFSKEDRAKFGLPDKSAGSSYLMKETCTLESFSDETKANFQKLFDLLKD